MLSTQGAELFFNDGNGTYAFYAFLESSSGAITGLAMDLDEDGHKDLIIGRMTGGSIVYYYQ